MKVGEITDNLSWAVTCRGFEVAARNNFGFTPSKTGGLTPVSGQLLPLNFLGL